MRSGPLVPILCAIMFLLAAANVFPGLSVGERVLAVFFCGVSIAAAVLVVYQKGIGVK